MKTQQCCVLTGAIGTILVGLAQVSVSRLLLNADVVLRHLESSFAPVLFALGVFLCMSGILGICGSCLSSRLTLGIYGLVSLLAAIVGLVLGGALLFAANMHSVDIQQTCNLFHMSGQDSSSLGRQYQASYDSMKQALQNCRRNGRSGALGLQDCGQLGRDNSGRWFQEDPQMEVLLWTERLSGCGGFCTSDLPLFGFPAGAQPIDQSSKLKQRSPCYKAVARELQVRGSMKGALITLLSLPLLAAVGGALWILCYPPPRLRKDYLHPSDVDNLESNRLLPAEQYRDGEASENSDEE